MQALRIAFTQHLMYRGLVMNDFTKQELNTLYEFLDNACENYHESEDVYELRDKIQSKIDNYCDHEFKKTLSKSGMHFISMCHKCRTEKPWSILDDN